MAAPKFTNFNKFLKCTLIGQLSQHSLTRWFRMKLKTTKHHWSHCTEKIKRKFGQPNIPNTQFGAQIVVNGAWTGGQMT